MEYRTSRNHNSAWTAERCGLLDKLWHEGKSATEIATELNCGFSRNAVIGKITRMGRRDRATGRKRGQRYLPNPDNPGLPRAAARPPAFGEARMENPRDTRHRLPSGALSPVEIPPDQFDMEIPKEQRRTLMELKPHDCRWPVGFPGTGSFYFCGALALNGQPYCPVHTHRSLISAAERRPSQVINWNIRSSK